MTHKSCLRCGTIIYDGTDVFWCEGELGASGRFSELPAVGELCEECDAALQFGNEAMEEFCFNRVQLMPYPRPSRISWSKRRRIHTFEDLERFSL